MTFIEPSINLGAFTCPHCGAISRQIRWGRTGEPDASMWPDNQLEHAVFQFSRCEHCSENCAWHRGTLIYPDRGGAPLPNSDMPLDVKSDYEEAARIHTQSPRGAAALLRLAIQKLMIYLGQPGKNINEDIGSLVAAGLPLRIQQALDIVRVTGNNAVHPGRLDANDVQIAGQLFPLVNMIVEHQISLPARLGKMFDQLPDTARKAIERRDT